MPSPPALLGWEWGRLVSPQHVPALAEKKRKCGGPARPLDRKHCPQCHPVRGLWIHCQLAPRPTPFGVRSPHVGALSPTRAQAKRSRAVPRGTSCPWMLPRRPRGSGATSLCNPTHPDRPTGGVRGAECRGGPHRRNHLPGRLRPCSWPPTEMSPEMAEAQAAGDWQKVPGISGHAEGGPDRHGQNDPAD